MTAPGEVVCGRPLAPGPRGGLVLGEPVAVTIRAGTIAAVAPARGEAEGRGAVLVPGWIDSHVHLFALAADTTGLDLSRDRPRSIGELLDRLAAASAGLAAGAWVRASGHDEAWLAERRHPTRSELDRAGGGRPVRLRHATRHASVLSSAALAALARRTSLPADRVPRDAGGAPLGVVYGMEREITAAVGPLPAPALAAALADASAELLALGIVSLDETSASNDATRVALLADAVAAGRVGQRVRVFLGDADELTAARHAARGRVEIAGVKLLPARAEEIAEPRFSRTVARARRCGLPVAIHAVEADAIDAALRALAAAPPRHGESAAPDRIEHASLCPPELSARIAAAGVAVVTQPAFLAERAVKYREEVEPPLWPWLYPLATLRAAGALVVGSSDAPVASADPRLAIAAAIGRSDGRGPAFAASEALDEAAALALYTSAPRALRGEAAPGPWLVPGRPADLLVLDRDPRGCWRDAVVVEARVGRGAARPSHAPAEGAA